MSSPAFPIAFPIVVLGDSIQWGQGLRPGAARAPSDKMAELVGVALSTDPTVVGVWTAGAGLAVSVSRFAHSGATINTALGAAPATTPTVTTTTAFPAGELPGGLPTILNQAASAPGVLGSAVPTIAASSVNLVILDGGINDVGLFTTILNPFGNPLTLAAMTNAACGGTLNVAGAAALAPPGAVNGQMSALLTAVGAAFPGAVIVVTGYYPIISLFSDLVGLAIAVGLLSGSVVPGILDPGGWLASVLSGSIAGSTAQAVVAGNCALFKSTSDSSLTSAVALANAAPGGSFSAQGVTAPRFMFVPAPFGPVNALFSGGSSGADETMPTAPAFLWGFSPGIDVIGAVIDSNIAASSTLGGILGFLGGGPLGAAAGSAAGALAGAAAAIAIILPTLTAVDEVAAPRAGACGGALACNLASVGHPNIEGEAAYAAAIAPPLITMFGTTLPAIGIIAVANAASSAGCLIVTAALGSPHARQVDRLRQLRDEFIARSRLGRDFFLLASSEYYAFSPIVAARMHSSSEFKDKVRCFAVSPLLGFVSLVSSWVTGLSAGEFHTFLTQTLDSSLEDLANAGIARNQVAAAAEQISRLNVHQGPGVGQRGEQHGAGVNELIDLVDYFNAVADKNVRSGGKYVNVLLLQPLKLYWHLLRIRASLTPESIISEFEAGLTPCLAGAAGLASMSQCSADDLEADLQVLCDMLGAEQSARRAFEASLFSDDREPRPKVFNARQERDRQSGAEGIAP